MIHKAENWDEMTGGLKLYRGFTRPFFDKIGEIEYPEDRKPVSIEPNEQIIIDDYFESVFGVRFRKRSLFCTGDLNTASQYKQSNGEVRSIRPMGDFQFCWSKNSHDLYYAIKYRPANEKLLELLKRLQFQNTDLEGALRSGNEIMITGVDGSKFLAEALNT